MMTKNTMVSYLRLCHSTVTMILSGEYRATQYDLRSVTPCNQLMWQPSSNSYGWIQVEMKSVLCALS